MIGNLERIYFFYFSFDEVVFPLSRYITDRFNTENNALGLEFNGFSYSLCKGSFNVLKGDR